MEFGVTIQNLDNITFPVVTKCFVSLQYKMALKRYSSAKDSIKKKVKKLDVEDAVDYTKLLTAEDVEIIESGDEQELSIANKPEKISSAKKAQSLKKKLPKTDKDGVSKKAKGNPITTTGIHLLFFLTVFFFK